MHHKHADDVRTHAHFTYGHPCTCPWGSSDDQEHLGSVKTSAKIDWLRGREDLQDAEGKEFLDNLEAQKYTEADALLPWLVREWRRGRCKQGHPRNPNHPWLAIKTRPELGDLEGAGGWDWLSPTEAKEVVDTLAEMKKHRQGLDVMQTQAHELIPKVKDFQHWRREQERPNLGEIHHDFGDGWTIRKLQNADEAKIEGDDMGHCVGGYGNGIDQGYHHIFSLRDPQNRPHATVELEAGENAYGDLRYNSVTQVQGKSNEEPIPEYMDRVNEWLERQGLDPHEPFEPWWEETYYVPGVRTADEYIGIHDGSHYQDGPDEYYRACNDAEDHGLEAPYLDYEPHEYDDIMRDHLEDFDPEVARKLEYAAVYNGDLETFKNEYDWWRENDYDEDYYQDAAQHWDRRWKQHTNPDTGKFERPLATYQNGQYVIKPALDQWWERQQQDYPQLPGVDWGEDPIVPQWMNQQMTARVANATPPLYYRWVLSPDTGDVELSSNQDDHPALVPYHEQLSGKINRPNLAHGYAYRIVGGYRITNWEHRPVEDPFIISQVKNALRAKEPVEAENGSTEPSWEPAAHDFDRLHYGLPMKSED